MCLRYVFMFCYSCVHPAISLLEFGITHKSCLFSLSEAYYLRAEWINGRDISLMLPVNFRSGRPPAPEISGLCSYLSPVNHLGRLCKTSPAPLCPALPCPALPFAHCVRERQGGEASHIMLQKPTQHHQACICSAETGAAEQKLMINKNTTLQFSQPTTSTQDHRNQYS